MVEYLTTKHKYVNPKSPLDVIHKPADLSYEEMYKYKKKRIGVATHPKTHFSYGDDKLTTITYQDRKII
jgi:hypothetical protein